MVYTDYYCDSGYEYYNTFVNDYWNPIIFTYVVQPYGEFVFTVGIALAAVVNLGYTFYTDSGFNNLAVLRQWPRVFWLIKTYHWDTPSMVYWIQSLKVQLEEEFQRNEPWPRMYR